MRKTLLIAGISIAAVLLTANGPAFAQEDVPRVACQRAFDEYGNLHGCDHSARLDNFGIQLMNEPTARGVIVVYAPESASKRIFGSITDYLVNTRGISAKRIKTIYGGYNYDVTEPRIQLWIVPKGADFEVEKQEVNLEAIKGMVAEYQDADYVELEYDGAEEDTGPPIGHVRYAAIEDILKAQKQSVAYIIAFDGSDTVPGGWKRVAESTLANLKRFSVDSDRVKIGYGGQAKDAKVQIWILPKGETPPIKDPASERPLAKAVTMGEFTADELGYAKNELAVFNRLLAVLRENPNMRACLVVTSLVPAADEKVVEEAIEPVVEEPDEPVDESGPAKPEPEPADVLKLADKWKNELAAKHKIGLDRIVLLYSKSASYASINIWLVPPGQPLPNPNADEHEEKASDVVKDPKSRP